MPQPGGDYFIIITSFLVLICFLDLTKAASYQMENYDLDMDSGGISNSSNEEEFYGGRYFPGKTYFLAEKCQ